jgi:hypothetical protein
MYQVTIFELILFLHVRVLLMMKVMNLQYYHLMLHYVGRNYSFNNIWKQKTTRRTEKEKKEKKQRKEEKKKKKSKRNYKQLLPTAKNRTGNLQVKVAGKLLYHDVFSAYMHHFVQDDPHPLKYVVSDIMKPSSSLPKRCTICPLAQLNSWYFHGLLMGRQPQ